MVGDPGTAADIVGRLVSHRRIRRAVASADDQLVVAALVREVLRSAAVPPQDDSPLSDLSRRERVAVVLAFAADWDPNGMAEAMHTTARRARVMVRRALDVTSEQQWRALLAADRWDVLVGADLDRRAAAARRQRRDRRAVSALAAGTAATLLTAVVTTAVRIATAPAPLPPTAKARGLLHWAPRGALVRDAHFLASATSLWRASDRKPQGKVYALYAGRVGDGRLAVLQALGLDGRPLVAIVADHDVTFNRPRLRLDLVAPLPRTDVPVLTVPYDGNLEIPGLTSGPGSRVLQALVAPGIDQVDERSLRAPPDTVRRPGFTQLELDDGLSEPWLDLSGSLPDTLVRAFRHGRQVFIGLVARSAVQPRSTAAAMRPPPMAWARLPAGRDPATMTDDILWWQQVCHSPGTSVSLVWAGRVRAVTTPVRLEFVQCPGSRLTARWLDGGTQGAQWIGLGSATADALAAVVPPDSLGPSTLVVVGSLPVEAIDVAGTVTPGRVARALIKGTEPAAVVVHDRDGRRLSVSLAELLPTRAAFGG
jgi:hypothetical protein